MTTMGTGKKFASVWDAIEDTPEGAVRMKTELDDVQTLATVSDSGALALALVNELTKRVEGVEVSGAFAH